MKRKMLGLRRDVQIVFWEKLRRGGGSFFVDLSLWESPMRLGGWFFVWSSLSTLQKRNTSKDVRISRLSSTSSKYYTQVENQGWPRGSQNRGGGKIKGNGEMRARLNQNRWREDASPFQAADSVVEAVSAEMEHRIKEEEVSCHVSKKSPHCYTNRT